MYVCKYRLESIYINPIILSPLGYHYWDVHCDKANNFEYDISCILYLNDEGEDFRGGEFVFMDTVPADTTIDMTKKEGGGYSNSSHNSSYLLAHAASDDGSDEFREDIVYSLYKSETAAGVIVNQDEPEKENGRRSSQSMYAIKNS